jgi:hypothetical protein
MLMRDDINPLKRGIQPFSRVVLGIIVYWS